MTEPPNATVTPPPSVVTARARRPWRHRAGIAALGMMAILAASASLIKVPYLIISPGEATPLDGRVVTVADVPTYRHEGAFLYLTVRITNDDPNIWRWLFARLDGDVNVEKKERVIGCASYAENEHFNDFLMDQSQDVAKTLALRALGYEVAEEGGRVVITGVLCDGPARGSLEAGDTLLAIDGTVVTQASEIAPIAQTYQPGDRVTFTVDRAGTRWEVPVRLGERNGESFVGIQFQTVTEKRFPFDVDIDIRRVGGPSAGLAFTLAVIDELSPGNLTGGRKVAVTGAVQSDGRVTDVGGVKQKTIAARESGAAVMLVPVREAADAREHSGGMRVLPVRTVDDALKALRRAGGDPVTTGPAAPVGQ